MNDTARMRVKVIGSGKPGDPWRVDLPTYTMLPGTEEFADPEKKVLKSVEVEVPNDYLDDKGRLSKEKIRAKYKGQPAWDRDDVLNDV